MSNCQRDSHNPPFDFALGFDGDTGDPSTISDELARASDIGDLNDKR